MKLNLRNDYPLTWVRCMILNGGRGQVSRTGTGFLHVDRFLKYYCEKLAAKIVIKV